MTFWYVLNLLQKRKWLLLTSVLATMTLTYAGTRLTGSTWKASAPFEVRPGSAPDNSADQGRGALDPQREMQEAGMQAVAYEAVLRKPDVLVPALNEIEGDNQIWVRDVRRRSDSVQKLLKSIKIETVGPHNYNLTITDSVPKRAGELVNALAKSFLREMQTDYTRDAQKAVNALSTQVTKIDAQIAKTRQAYNTARSQSQVVSSQQQDLDRALTQMQGLRVKRDDLQQKLADVQARLSVAGSELAKMPRTVPVQVATSDDPIIKDLQAQLAQDETQLTTLRVRYTPQKIEVRQLTAQRDAVQKRLNAELAKKPKTTGVMPNPALLIQQTTVAGLREDITGSQAQLHQVNASLASVESQVRQAGGTDAIGGMLQDITQLNEQRSNLVARLQSANMDLDKVARQNPIHFLTNTNQFNPPENMKAGRTVKLLLIAAFCSFLLGCGLLIGYDGVDRRLRNVHDVEVALTAPVCAAIPQAIETTALARITDTDPSSAHAVAYHFLGMQLLRRREHPIRSLLVTSAKAVQGSTNTVSNLGITLAQAGNRVIIVDANLRSPHLHEIFGVSNDYGLTDLLAELEPGAIERSVKPTLIDDLRVIPSGPAVRNPWKLLRSPHLAELVRRLEAVADYVLFDTPSALAFPDAMNVATVADGVLLCVRALEEPSGEEESVIETFRQEGVEVLGVVLSNVPVSLLASYSHYQHYYPGTLVPGSGKSSPRKLTGGAGSSEQPAIAIATLPVDGDHQPEGGHPDVDFSGNGHGGSPEG